MSEVVLSALTVALCLIGLVFIFGGTIGLLRFPDLYSRLHPLTKGDTLGAMAIILALCLRSGLHASTLKLLAIIVFVLLSSAICGHAIGRSALISGIAPWRKEEEPCRSASKEVDPWSSAKEVDP